MPLVSKWGFAMIWSCWASWRQHLGWRLGLEITRSRFCSALGFLDKCGLLASSAATPVPQAMSCTVTSRHTTGLLTWWCLCATLLCQQLLSGKSLSGTELILWIVISHYYILLLQILVRIDYCLCVCYVKVYFLL